MNAIVPVTMKPRFVGFEGIKHYSMPQGLTLQQIAVEIGPDLPPTFWTGDGVICVNDQRVPQEYWYRIKPRVNPAREIVVTFHVVPRGGKTAGILTTIAGVALTAAGIFFQQPWLISLGVGVTLSGVGMLLAPPPPQPKQGQESKTLQAGISGNPPAPFEWMPRILGSIVYSPLPLIRPYTIYSRGSILVGGAFGLVGRHAVTNVRINGALAASMSNLTYQTKTGASTDTALTIGNKWVWEESPRIRLSNFDLKTDSSQRDELYDQSITANSYPQYQTFLTRSGDSADKVVIRFLFPQGMSADVDSDVASAIPIRIEFRRRGSSTWILGPEFHFWDENKGKSELRQNITFLWQADTIGRIASVNNDRIGYVAYYSAGSTVIGGVNYTANSYFSNGSSRFAYHVGRDDDGYTVYLNPSTFPKDHYEFRVKRGLAYRQGLFLPSSYAYDGSGQKGVFFDHYTTAGIAKVRVDHEFKIRAEAQIEAFQTWRDEYPLQDALSGSVPLTLIGIEGRDMEINSVSATFESQVAIYSGGNWNTVTTSRNPAAHYRHVLLDNLNADPRAPEIVNSGVLEDWYNICVTNGYECNEIVSANEPDVLAMIASAGWAGMRSHEQWEVIFERNTSSFSITQLFTPLNSSNYVASKAFADLPQALNVEYADEDDDNNLKTIIIYAPGYSAANATRFETLRLSGFTDEDKVVARATNLLRVLYYRQTERRIDVGIEALASIRGDVVGLAHDLKDEHIWFGTIARVIDNGTNVTGVVLNGKALLSLATAPFSAAIRYMNQVVVIKQIIETADTATLTFSTPFAIPSDSALRKGCVVSVGVRNAEVSRCRISNIRYKDELTATISMVDEASQIYTGFFAAVGNAAGTSTAAGVGAFIATLRAVGTAQGTSQGLGVGDYLGVAGSVGAAFGIGAALGVGQSSGTVARAGSASAVSTATAVGMVTGLASTVGAAVGVGAATAVGRTINTIGVGTASGAGTATAIAPAGVPSSTFIYKGALTDTANKVAGEKYEWLAQDIGVAHANRIIVIGAFGGNFTPNNVSGLNVVNVNGVTTTLIDQKTGFALHYIAVPTGTTVDFEISMGSSGTRAAIIYGIYYPASATPLAFDSTSGTGSTNAQINNITLNNPGLVVIFGGQGATVGNFAVTINGATPPTINEDYDSSLESASSLWFGHINSAENSSTRDLTMAETTTGTKYMIYAAWGASA